MNPSLPTRRAALLRLGVAAASAAAAAAGAAAAQADAGPVRVLIGFPPGTTADVLARALAPVMSEALQQQVLVENKPGAGSSLAAEEVARAKPDGRTLLLSTIANAINPALYPRLAFDFTRDLAPVALIAEAPALLVAHPALNLRTPADLVARAKAQRVTYASSGNGTVTHLYGEQFAQATGVKLEHIPYRGSSQAVTDALAGRVDLMFTPASTVLQHVKAGTLTALGAIGRQRLQALPDLKLLAEGGLQGFGSALWFGLNSPAGLPREVAERFRQAVAQGLASPAVRQLLAAQGIEATLQGGEAFGQLIAQDTAKWAAVVKAGGIKVE